MEVGINQTQPWYMHIDLNSCFAMIEQQANPLIRNKPVVVAAYDTPRGMVLAASYEAKALGIKLGFSVGEARARCPGIIALMPDPDKYFDAHRRFREVLLHYTDDVTPKSIDEFVLDLRGSPAAQRGMSLAEIGMQIKEDIKQSLGSYVTVNVGIGPNRFLAKLAAGLHKPDGLNVITADNLLQTYAGIELLDLPGINVRYRARLALAGIHTPLDFFDASSLVLRKQVFKGIFGYYWYLRLRGHEIDNVQFARRSFGQQYALSHKTTDRQELARLLMKLCEKAGRRLRAKGYTAAGINLSLTFEDRSYWYQSHKTKATLYATQDIFRHAVRLLDQALVGLEVTKISVTVFNIEPARPQQLGLFDDTRLDSRSLAVAADAVNDRYGEFTVVPAIMANMKEVILKRIAFGNVHDIP